MTRNKAFLLFIPVALALALLLGVNWTIRPAQASGLPGKASPVIPNSLAQVTKLERVTVLAEGDQVNAPEATCTISSSSPDHSGRVVHFPLNEAAGATTFTSSVGGLTGYCVGDTCPTKTTGVVQGAFSFDGGDQITVTYDAVTDWTQTQDFSLEAWVNFTAACDGRKVFLGKYGGTSNNTAWWLGCEDTSNQAAFNLRSSAVISGTTDKDTLTIAGGPALNDGKWHHVVAVHDAISTTTVVTDTNYLYVDGSLVASEEHNYLDGFVSDADLNIGWYNALGSFYQHNGKLDEVAIYDKVMSASQVSKNWLAYCNDPPVAGDDALTTAENVVLVIQEATLTANDTDPNSANGDDLTLTMGGSTAQGGTVTGSGPWTYSPKTGFGGVDTFTYTATDLRGAFDTATVTVTVTSVNHAPNVTNPGPKSNNEGDTVNLQIAADDQDVGQIKTFSALNLPPGLSINPTTGLVSGTIGYEAAQLSPYEVEVTVTDNYTTPASTSVKFNWTVSDTNRAPQVTNPGGKTNQVGDQVNLPIVAVDLDGDSLTFSATSLPDGLSIHPTTGVISGTIAATAKGNYAVKVTVTDGKTPKVVEFVWTIGVPKVYLPLLLRDVSQIG